jgi:hypothetical protein
MNADLGQYTQDQCRVLVVTDGRLCRLCNEADSSRDPLAQFLMLSEPRWWGYPPDKDGKTHGYFCGYCLRVFIARYKKAKGWTVTHLVEVCGTDLQEYDSNSSWALAATRFLVFVLCCGVPGWVVFTSAGRAFLGSARCLFEKGFSQLSGSIGAAL